MGDLETYHDDADRVQGAAERLLEAAQFAHSVLVAGGMFDRSEQLAVDHLATAIRAAGATPRQPRSLAAVLAEVDREEGGTA